MLDQFKTERRQQGPVFAGIKARVIKRVTPIAADGFTVSKAGIEHQNGVRRRVCRKYAKHGFLIPVPEMKEAVPGQYPGKSPAKSQ